MAPAACGVKIFNSLQVRFPLSARICPLVSFPVSSYTYRKMPYIGYRAIFASLFFWVIFSRPYCLLHHQSPVISRGAARCFSMTCVFSLNIPIIYDLS